jgi:hypothetical protein
LAWGRLALFGCGLSWQPSVYLRCRDDWCAGRTVLQLRRSSRRFL